MLSFAIPPVNTRAQQYALARQTSLTEPAYAPNTVVRDDHFGWTRFNKDGKC
ncbi:MAG: hypothetical protein M1434_14375 [Chloroflexi bacterium]|nr:hypothetical protein [Chloroflexota bacterium]MCL5275905.1 hypothetical protein [Chloroflexota bacterium]